MFAKDIYIKDTMLSLNYIQDNNKCKKYFGQKELRVKNYCRGYEANNRTYKFSLFMNFDFRRKCLKTHVYI